MVCTYCIIRWMTFCPEVSIWKVTCIFFIADPRLVQWLTGSRNLRTDNFLHLWVYLAVSPFNHKDEEHNAEMTLSPSCHLMSSSLQLMNS